MTTPLFAAEAGNALTGVLSSPTEIFALCAAAAAGLLTVTSSFVKTMVPLRWLAVGSNIGFLAYGVLHPSPVMALLHATLLPINVIRLIEMRRLTRRVKAASTRTDTSGIWLKPYMKATRCRAGEILFQKGDPAEHLYLLVEGRIELVEIGKNVDAGRVFGEIAFFAPSHQRTLTARCMEPSLVLKINQRTVRELYHQNPAFGLELIELVAGRLSADVERLQRELAEARAPQRPNDSSALSYPDADHVPTAGQAGGR